MRHIFLRPLLGLFFGLFFIQLCYGIDGVDILSFSPQNYVKDVRQVKVSFSSDMIAFGDPRSTNDPFQTSCTPSLPSGHSRWADSKNWIFDFDQDLEGGIQCTFTVKQNLKSLSGKQYIGKNSFSFNTGGPVVISSEPYSGSETIDEEQIFILRLNAKANSQTLLQNVYFSEEGVGEKIPIKLLDKDPRPTTDRDNDEKNIVILQAQRKFIPNAKVTLVWGAGVATLSGIATTQNITYPYKVRPEFSIEFNCERDNANAACSPISSMTLNFNADVPWAEVKQIKLKADSGKEWYPYSNKKLADDEPVTSATFNPLFPEKTQFHIILPSNLQDDAGRPLVNTSRFPLATSTAEYTPLIKFPATFGVLELNPEAVLPVTVRNVEPNLSGNQFQIAGKQGLFDELKGKIIGINKGDKFLNIIDWLIKVENADREKSLFSTKNSIASHDLSIKKPNGGKAFEVIGIPLKNPGFYVVEFESKLLGVALLAKQAPMYVSTSALVTNLSVHFKKGRESSLIWVTSLDQGKPIADAVVAIRNCKGATLASGKTNAQGIFLVQKESSTLTAAECPIKDNYSPYSYGLFVTAEKGDDFSFVHTSWNKGIEAWRFNMPEANTLAQNYGTTVFDRTLFRAGEEVHMKHFVRKHTSNGIELPNKNNLPTKVIITHEESEQSYELPLTWHGSSVSESTWSIPKNAKLGVYSVQLVNAAKKIIESGDFRVEEYRIPLMRGQIKPPSTDVVAATEIPFDFSVEYLSGGTAAKLPIQVRSLITDSAAPYFSSFEDYWFGLGKYKNPDTNNTQNSNGTNKAKKQSLILDKSGTARLSIPVVQEKQDQIKSMQVELEYKDPNGETQTVARSVTIYPSSTLIAIKPDSWFATKQSLKFNIAVVDLHGKAVVNAPVDVQFLEQKTYTHRKRLVGGFYSYENSSQLVQHGQACVGKTDDKGLLACNSIPPVSGNVILEAKTTDTAGRSSYSYSSTWVSDTDQMWFAQDDSDKIDLLPERKNYEVGENAVFQVRMPFKEATALVTVEREGILDSFVVPLSGAKPLIQVPIKESYSPNVFVSALVVRGRIGDIQPTALIDLGKPAYKLGIAPINVAWKPHELKVKVEPSKNIYEVRENANVKIHVDGPNGQALPMDSEVAVAVVDEGLLELKPNTSWNLLQEMMNPRGYEIETYTAQSQVVGKRHFGLKAVSSGGDGGKAPSREIFDSLVYWNANVKLDVHGDAQVQFPMNDSITGFKIAAVAYGGAALFGTGYATIHTTQDLMLMSGVPPLAREGDHMVLEFTLRNTTAQPMSVTLNGKAKGVPNFSNSNISLAANEAKTIQWPVDIPLGISTLQYEISANDTKGKTSDKIKITQKIIPAVPVRTFQATLVQIDKDYQLPVERPKDALPDRGEIKVTLNSTILSGLAGVNTYMSDYPYSCLEQRASKAVTLGDQKLWQSIVNDLPNYLDKDGFAKYFPIGILDGSDVLTSYVLSISDEAGFNIPEDSRNKMLDALKNFVEGRVNRAGDLPTADLTIRKLSALEALSRYKKANAAMLDSLQITPNLWPTSAVIDWIDFLKRMQDVPNVTLKQTEADSILRARLNFQGTTMGFSTEENDDLWWMMTSISTNANRLLLAELDDPQWRNDMGRLARGAISRQQHGHWDTTTANAWGVLAMKKFARLFEKDPVTGTTSAQINTGDKMTLNWSKQANGTVFDMKWPNSQEKLSLSHSGSGKPWATIQSLAAIPLKIPFSSGYKVTKTWIPVEQKIKGHWSKGDIVKIHLELESQADMTWAVLNDPIPAGSIILGSGLGNDSALATADEKATGWLYPAYQERAFDAYRAYYRYMPKGNSSIEYTIRFNESGRMNTPPTRLEAMYAPEMFGESPNNEIQIEN